MFIMYFYHNYNPIFSSKSPPFSIYIPLNPISAAQMHMGVGAWATYQWAQPQINDFPSPNSHRPPINSSARVGAPTNTDILSGVWFSSIFFVFYFQRTYKLEISKKPDIFKDFSKVLDFALLEGIEKVNILNGKDNCQKLLAPLLGILE